MMKEEVGEKTAMNVWKRRCRPLRKKTAGTSGFHQPCSSPQSHLVEKNCQKKKKELDLVPVGLPPASSPASPFGPGVPAAPKLRRGRRGMFTKPASCRCLGPLRFVSSCAASCQWAALTFLRDNRSKKCLFRSQPGASPPRASRILPFVMI